MIETVSLCTVVYNEGNRIYEMLKYAEPHVDEMIIVDQRSNDNTVSEIERFASTTDKFVQILFDKHWGYCEPSRIKAHQNSIGEWVLVLDADERISDEFAADMRTFNDVEHPVMGKSFYKGCRLQRSLWISGVHSWTGDYQYRYFRRDAVNYLDEIHTEPQPTCHNDRIYWRDYIGIWHHKTWAEQIRDEHAYLDIIGDKPGANNDRKRDISSVYTQLLINAGVTAEQADAMTQEEREAIGLGLSPWQ
jgi:glycosyltransferase involved in cell wall biosynthesis